MVLMTPQPHFGGRIMRFVTNRYVRVATVAAILTASSLVPHGPAAAAERSDAPNVESKTEGARPEGLSFPQIRQIVEKNLKANPTYRDGDLIVRCDVEPIFNELIGLGFMPADTEELYDAFIPDMALLIQMLRPESGREFMRQIRDIEGAYDRLERLSWLPGGHVALGQLINAEDAAEKVRLLTSAAGAAAIRKQFPDDQRAQNFDRPTGHIHTAAQLLKHLEKIHKQRSSR
jgi:hypothetical protein